MEKTDARSRRRRYRGMPGRVPELPKFSSATAR